MIMLSDVRSIVRPVALRQEVASFVIEDDRVITGQNPTSAHAVGEAIVKQLAE